MVTSFGFVRANPSQQTLIVVVSKRCPINEISLAQLKQLFRSERREVASHRLIPLNRPPGSATRIKFDKLVLGMNPEQVGRFWIDRKMRGQTKPPRSVSSLRLVIKVVTQLPNAISYIRHNQLTPDLRMLRVDGKLPGDQGYALAERHDP